MKLSSILPLIWRFAPVDDCSSSPNLFTQLALKNAGRRIAIPILQVLQDDRAANLLHFQGVRMLVTFRSEQQTASYQPGIIRKAITTCYLFVGREAAHQWKSSLLRCGCGAVRPR